LADRLGKQGTSRLASVVLFSVRLVSEELLQAEKAGSSGFHQNTKNSGIPPRMEVLENG
jgi:hypothetical protein